MDAKEIKLLKFLQDDHQLYIPIFQRKYSWNSNQCEKLFEDILKVGSKNNNSTHFIGSVVYMNEGLNMVGPISKRMVIDGQQRLTTITLLISALAIFLKNNPIQNYSYQDLVFYYLSNTRASGEEKYKLILNDEDKKSLLKIIDNISSNKSNDFNKTDSKTIINNYMFFLNRINKNNISNIITGLNKLNLIQIALEQGKDNPQLIYESLNSTGLELSKADLIRNFVLMTFNPTEQKRIYEIYWKDMENGFNQTNLFDRFIRDYLTIKLNEIPKISEVYTKFKEFASNWNDMKELLKEINTYSKYYFSICFGDDEDKNVKYAFKNFNYLKSNVCYPFLLTVYEDYDNKNISKEELLEIINIIESYVFRRSICEIPTNSLNKTFAILHNEIDKNNYVESLKSILLLKDSYKRFPNNEEFKNHLLTKNVYNYNYSKYLLSNLENYKHPKNYLNFKNYTIEHIMPQKLSEDWKKELGKNYLEIHEKYLHTIGNLTLTAYNSELSDSSFKHKQEMKNGFKDSPLYLNKYISKLNSWSEEEINNRSNELIKLAIDIWPYPKICSETIKKYSKKISSYSMKQKQENKEIIKYTEKDAFKNKPYNYNMELLYNNLKKRILSEFENIEIIAHKYLIVFKTKNQRVIVIEPFKNFLKIWITLKNNELNDPLNKTIDISNIKYKVGEYEIKINKNEDINYFINLFEQAYIEKI